MHADTNSSPPAPTAIDRDVLCHRCGYNLRTLHADGRCPECGEAVSATLIHRPVDPQWLRGIARWCHLLVVGNVLLIAGMVTSAWGPFKELAIPLAIGVGGFRIWLIGVSRQLAGFGTAAEAFPISLSLLGVACTIAGTLLVARRDPDMPRSPRLHVVQGLLMLTGIAAALLTIWMLAAASGLGSRRAGQFEVFNRGVWIVAAVDPPHVILLTLWLSHVARRLRRPGLRRATLATGVGVAATAACLVIATFFSRGGWIPAIPGVYAFAAAGALSVLVTVTLALASSRAAR